MRWVGAARSWACALVAASVSGCAGRGPPGEGYVERYNHREYAAAKAEAETALKQASPGQREQASLIAGLSAQALAQAPDAKRYLRPLVSSTDPAVAGRAGAALGLIARDEGDKAGAARLLSAAAPKLAGEESAKAAMFAGDAYQALRQPQAARAQYAAALRVAESPRLKQQIEDRMGGKRFTVQLGAYATRANAEGKAAEAAPRCRAAGIEAPRVVTGVAGGRAMFMVRIGEFPLRQEAAAALNKLGPGEGRVMEID